VTSDVPASQIAEGYASTCRTLAYVMRGSEPAVSARWYLRALCYRANRLLSLKGLIITAIRAVCGPRQEAASAENATVNR
jgi:hypothetical protein